MSRSQEKNQAKLKAIYGVDFPEALFWLHEFITRQSDDSIGLSDIQIYPCGPLALLLDFDDISKVEFTGNPLLYDRYYRDIPEFFTCLSGDSDGQHWGMLLEEPIAGFRGVAMYWSNDGAEMTVYQSLLDAIQQESEDCIASFEDEMSYTENEEDIQEYKERSDLCQRLINELNKFMIINSLSYYEGRPIGVETRSGLDIILPSNFDRDSNGEAIEMLKAGRDLWYWNGDTRSEEAFNLMRQAYTLLERHELIRILDTHYHCRNLPSVDLIKREVS
jgi:hypothetical protein